MRRRQERLFGILNGVDYDEWNTTENRILAIPYTATRLAGKNANKLALQKELGLPVAPDVPLFGTITRLAEQKGVDIQLARLQEMLARTCNSSCSAAARRILNAATSNWRSGFPARCAVRIGFDDRIVASHRGRLRFLPDAVAVRAVRLESDV